MTQPRDCNARNTAPGEYGSDRKVGWVPFITDSKMTLYLRELIQQEQ